MWMPTHVQVTVQRAENLLLKGKNNTNDCFVTIALGKTKYQTSVKEKSGQQVEWHEECELPIPDQGNTAEIILTALHHNYLGIDEFLGRVTIPLSNLDIYERPKNKWFVLQSKPGKAPKNKERGKLEVKIGFTVKSGSLTSLNKKEKHRSSIGQLSHVAQSVGGSLMSLGSAEKRKGIKKFAKSIGSKMNFKGKKKDGSDDGSSIGSVGSLNIKSGYDRVKSKQSIEDADPGVVSDDDDFTLDDLSHKSSTSSLNHSVSNRTASPTVKIPSVENMPIAESERKISTTLPPVKPRRLEVKHNEDEWDSKLIGNKPRGVLKPGSTESLNRRSWDSSKVASQIDEEPSNFLAVPTNKLDTISLRSNKSPEMPRKEGMFPMFKHFRKDKSDSDHGKFTSSNERIILGGETEIKIPAKNSRISAELLQKFDGKTREDLILTLVETQHDLQREKAKLKDLENYLDDLLLRVMETTPGILQNPYITYKLTARKEFIN